MIHIHAYTTLDELQQAFNGNPFVAWPKKYRPQKADHHISFDARIGAIVKDTHNPSTQYFIPGIPEVGFDAETGTPDGA